MIRYISSSAIPIMIAMIIIYGLLEKNKVYDTFVQGAKEGIEIVVTLFPTLLGIFIAVGALRSSGILDTLLSFLSPLTNLFHIPSEIMPLALLRPISGSASTAIATDIMQNFGVDSKLRTNGFYYYGVNRNNFLYNCYLYKLCRNKKN